MGPCGMGEKYERGEKLIDGNIVGPCGMGEKNERGEKLIDGNIVGPCGMGEKNERGEKLIEFCQSRKLTITNTYMVYTTKQTEIHMD